MTRIPRPFLAAVHLVVTALVGALLSVSLSSPAKADAAPLASAPEARVALPSARRPPSPNRVLKHNPIYRVKALKDRACIRHAVPLDTAAHVTEYYTVLKGCLDKAWRKKVKKAGLRWRKPAMVVWSQAVSTPCGPGEIYVSTYCPVNRTMYLNVEEVLAWARDPARDGLGGRLGWLRAAFVLSHEYGHHIQTQMGVWKAIARKVSTGRTTWAASTPATELQASCLALVFLHSIRATYPIEDAVLADWRWRLIRLASHGTDANQMFWMDRGFATGRPKACNVFKAPAGLRA
ncbi:hypothetical protein FHP29_08300 [Nocardioides albidus]|uniref:Metalloprotease n=1 Tax=Nocardioides albidus TaxID=1517589 RepID=A0A5C4W1B9_9ACTN|nr:neutral zinc metallopeptidase [Nocardioides albidus]TNM41962.1 hypothetical protein FHP29_08300 [Nocardioides albidus]